MQLTILLVASGAQPHHNQYTEIVFKRDINILIYVLPPLKEYYVYMCICRMITDEYILHADTIIGRGECVELRSAGDISDSRYALIVAFNADTIEVCLLTELPSIASNIITDPISLKLPNIRVLCAAKPVHYIFVPFSDIICNIFCFSRAAFMDHGLPWYKGMYDVFLLDYCACVRTSKDFFEICDAEYYCNVRNNWLRKGNDFKM